MKIYSTEQVAKWRAEAQRRKGLEWFVYDYWSENRIVNLAISHENLRYKMEYLAEELRTTRDTGERS